MAQAPNFAFTSQGLKLSALPITMPFGRLRFRVDLILKLGAAMTLCTHCTMAFMTFCDRKTYFHCAS